MLEKIPDLSKYDITKRIPEDSPLAGNLNFSLPNGITFQPSYIQAGLIVVLLFLLVLTLGSLRHRMAHWEMKGALGGVVMGFLLAIILEGILVVSGSTILTATLGWKNAPKPISVALDKGRNQLTDVLGITDQVEVYKDVTPEQVLMDMKSLTRSEYDSVLKLVCE